ncbi:MAG TPA: hypothetical protein ENN07_05760 [candidate division Zixibacteria bacterium]|nr:hypothetical protein [candidate division Zixibacteria bacterium]
MLSHIGSSAIIAILLICAVAFGGSKDPLETVGSVDLERYLGRWFEVARYPTRFQNESCVVATADYSLMDNGQIRVLNTCWKDHADGEMQDKAEGRAKSVSDNNSRLKVSFFRPFWANYWIIDLGHDYEYAVVSAPSRKYLWILCRESSMDTALFDEIVARLESRGFQRERLLISRAQRERIDG